MPTITSNYILPAIFLNPAVILHLINTFLSHIIPPPPSISHSPHPFFESLGPLRNAAVQLDMHADDQLCWSYTALMVLVQILAFGRVNDNRVRRNVAKAAILERERIRKEKTDEDRKTAALKGPGLASGGLDGTCDVSTEPKPKVNGAAEAGAKREAPTAQHRKSDSESGTSGGNLSETSEEEQIH
ncbi:hypothetical protein MBM_03272 [Drepanopeziza brunnea f. sp. 'multigermtubi' MB_m1]|uniref:Uncharacterized protein n=2 Tax=Drepanopeziza brunnea f. sp. 'multigermtubi' TaxID=698441 RepID=K1XZM4_MARBU|nr:uncharacterized protein MBM_03272 [Drepanopeziza brunnea f. sp. 'multigermtubi' MB_m1]EKD18279.1 hypothetical protein MBM_03272 [Drepanopeziza brunnea f. sp. 'multigermtubi' MB_m1]